VIIRFYRKGRKDHYGFFKFMFDVIATICTAGFWLIWIFVREMRK